MLELLRYGDFLQRQVPTPSPFYTEEAHALASSVIGIDWSLVHLYDRNLDRICIPARILPEEHMPPRRSKNDQQDYHHPDSSESPGDSGIVAGSEALSTEATERLALTKEIYLAMVENINNVDPRRQDLQDISENFLAIFHPQLLVEMKDNRIIAMATSEEAFTRDRFLSIVEEAHEANKPHISRYTRFDRYCINDVWNGILPAIAAALTGKTYRDYVERIYNEHGCSAGDGYWIDIQEDSDGDREEALSALIRSSLDIISDDYDCRTKPAKAPEGVRLWT